MSQQNCAVILAAGEGKRMKRERPKSLSPVLFKPMLQWVLDSAREAGIGRTCVVTGYRHEQVEQYLSEHDPETSAALQSERKGTGHAVMMAADFLRSEAGGANTLILNGDAPFISAGMIRGALQCHTESRNAVTVISAALEDPTGYGRILRDEKTRLVRGIVEQKDATPEEAAVCEVNSGAYWFRTDDLLEILGHIQSDNAQGEYYLTDAVRLLIEEGKRADAWIPAARKRCWAPTTAFSSANSISSRGKRSSRGSCGREPKFPAATGSSSGRTSRSAKTCASCPAPSCAGKPRSGTVARSGRTPLSRTVKSAAA